MLHLQAFTFNPFQENTFVLYNDEKQGWIVDPGMYNPAEHLVLKNFLQETDIQLQAIINTHTHIDHICGVQSLLDEYAIPFGIHRLDLPILQGAAGYAAMLGFDFGTAPQPSFFISEKEPLLLGADPLQVLLAPGHSPGSICFYSPEGQWLIGGDVLFNGSIGRSDLPGGNYDTLLHSIQTQLLPLPDDTVVLPGHGPATTIGREKATNPFLR